MTRQQCYAIYLYIHTLVSEGASLEPLDLTLRAPRSPRVQLGGLLMMARTVDKARALLPGGNPGRYYISPGISAWLLGKLGFTEAQFLGIVAQSATDEEVAAHFSGILPDEKRRRINQFIQTFTIEDVPEEMQAVIKGSHTWSWPQGTPMIEALEEDDRRNFPTAASA